MTVLKHCMPLKPAITPPNGDVATKTVPVGAGPNAERPQTARGKGAEWQWMARQDETYRQREDNDILGRDPEGPLAPEEGQRPYSTVEPTPAVPLLLNPIPVTWHAHPVQMVSR